MKKISIIIPIYNAGKYLSSCIESILNQTYHNLEVLLINDGSTDNSALICEEYAKKDDRIIFISQPNQGPGVARNTGLDIASGDYIGFVDSDDIIVPEMYKEMLNMAFENNADIVHCGYEKVNLERKVLRKSKFKDITITGTKNCIFELCLRRNANYYCCCKLIKKSIIGNIRFNELAQSEDALFLLKVFMNCNILTVTNKPYYKYILTPNSICRSNYNLKKLDAVKAGKELYKIVDEKYPDLSIHYAKYIARYAIRGYMGINLMGNFSEKEMLLATMYEDFSENFRKVQRSNIKLLDWFTKAYLHLFYYSPKFTAQLYKFKSAYL